jgi:hypothetical protein
VGTHQRTTPDHADAHTPHTQQGFICFLPFVRTSKVVKYGVFYKT